MGVGRTGGVPAWSRWMSGVSILICRQRGKVILTKSLREDLLRIDGDITLDVYRG